MRHHQHQHRDHPLTLTGRCELGKDGACTARQQQPHPMWPGLPPGCHPSRAATSPPPPPPASKQHHGPVCQAVTGPVSERASERVREQAPTQHRHWPRRRRQRGLCCCWRVAAAATPAA
jgi:hypothetical protein